MAHLPLNEGATDWDSMRKILVYLAHPRLDRSNVHAKLVPMVRAHTAVTFVDIYADYPDSMIDVRKEQKRLRAHDVILFQHPVYWYSTPGILKDWQDLVLEYGFAYGQGGTALQGKAFGQVVSTGAPFEDYRKQGANQSELHEIFTPLRTMARFCGMRYLEPLALYHAQDAAEDDRLQNFELAYSTYLDALANAQSGFEDFTRKGDFFGVLRALVGR